MFIQNQLKSLNWINNPNWLRDNPQTIKLKWKYGQISRSVISPFTRIIATKMGRNRWHLSYFSQFLREIKAYISWSIGYLSVEFSWNPTYFREKTLMFMHPKLINNFSMLYNLQSTYMKFSRTCVHEQAAVCGCFDISFRAYNNKSAISVGKN